ncbi:MAG: ketopantoate reductase family protein [Clostridiales bacterium]|nr:ketopantoate reductase family protein [Clostridiales bacterium]
MKEIHSAAIVGMGALGMLFASQITAALGPDAVCFVAESDRVAKYQQMRFTVNHKECHFPVIDSRNAIPADLVIVAVKSTALTDALDTMAGCVGPDTIIISVINGITSEEIIGARYGMEHIIYCVAQGMDAVKFGGDLTYIKPGELRIGILEKAEQNSSEPNEAMSTAPDRLAALVRYLDRVGIAYTVEPDIRYRLWGKFMLNVGINQICMVFETTYGGAVAPGKPRDTMIAAMREVIALANAEGIALGEKEIADYIALMETLSPEGMPSMRQDGVAHRPSEVELFSGTVRKRSAKYGLPTPVNDWLYTRIKEMEANY